MNKKEKLMQEIWTTYHPKLQVYLTQLFPKTPDIEDRVSEILLKVFDRLDNYNPKFALSTWIYRIARNDQIDQIRRVVIQSSEYSDETLTCNSTTPEDLFFKVYEEENIRKIIKSLKPTERELIFLHFYEGLKYREINEITGMAIGTIKYNMSCIKDIIKSKLERSECYER